MADKSDKSDDLSAYRSISEVSKNAPNSQIDAIYESEKMHTHAYNLSALSDMSAYPLQVNHDTQNVDISKMKDNV